LNGADIDSTCASDEIWRSEVVRTVQAKRKVEGSKQSSWRIAWLCRCIWHHAQTVIKVTAFSFGCFRPEEVERQKSMPFFQTQHWQ